MIKKYFRNLFVALDQLVNAIAFGDPDETISSRLGKNYRDSRLRKLVDWMFKSQNKEGGHCVGSIEYDEGRDSIIK